jgi:hypothetical protein
MAIVAGLALGHLGQEGLFFQLALVGLGQGLTRAQNHIDEEAADEEDGYQ